MADAEFLLKIVKDPSSNLDKSLADSQRGAERLGDTIADKIGGGGGGAFRGLASLIDSRLVGVLGLAGVAAVALKKQFDFTLEAEKMDSIHKSFDNLSASFNLAGASLQAGLLSASRGLADDEAILQASNKAIIGLGENAKIIPETMELARKATAAFGGDLVSNFETFNDAIASGNVRALRQFGIIIDSTKAEKDFAASKGLTVDTLNEAGKKQAILNAVLEQGKAKLAGVSEDTLKATNSFQRFKVSLGEIGDGFKQAVSNSSGFSNFFDALSKVADNVGLALTRNFGKPAEQATAQTQLLKNQVVDLQAEMEKLSKPSKTFFGLFDNSAPKAQLDALQELINQKKAQIDSLLLKESEDGQKAFQRSSQANAGKGSTVVPIKPGGGFGDADKIAQKAAQAQSTLEAMRSSLLSANEAYYQQTADLGQRTVDLDAVAGQRKLQIAADYDARLNQLKANQRGASALSAAQFAEAEILLESEKQARIAAVQSASQQKMLADQKTLRDGFKNTLASGISSSIQSFTNALVKGENAFEAFGGAILSMFGDLAIQTGQFFIAQGIAMLALDGLEPTGTIAAGVGLVALGSLLKAFIGKGSAGGGTAGAGSSGAAADVTASPTTQPVKPQTNVTINVQGDILDKRETGLRLAEILSDHISNNDGRIVGVA